MSRSEFEMKAIIIIVFTFFTVYTSSTICQDKSKPDAIHHDSAEKDSALKTVKLTIRNPASLTIEFNIMYDYGVYELSGNYNGDFSTEQFSRGENFGVRHGVGGVLTVKIPLQKSGHLRLNISVSHNNFSSRFNKTLTSGLEQDFMKYNVFSIISGIENNFTPNFIIKTYAGIGLIGSIINGNGRITTDGISNELTILPAFRLGLSINSGFEYMVSNKFGFNCGIRFTHANLWFKNSKESNNPKEIYLNDQRSDDKLPYSGFKQFAWGSFFAGVNYYFGIEPKVYIYKSR